LLFKNNYENTHFYISSQSSRFCYYSNGSTFTEVAWWLGKCEPNVIIPKSPNITSKDEEDFFTLK